MDKVLVTGGTGFLASWIIRKLLEKGYEVKTTVRSEKKQKTLSLCYSQKALTQRNFPLFLLTLMNLMVGMMR